MSVGASTTATATERSASHLRRLRQRLRLSGALPSSRSIVSKHDELFDEDVIDVGHGKHANECEHFLARLEQHGLRRCFCTVEPPSIYGVAPCVAAQEKSVAVNAPATEAAPADLDDADAREPYYYCCVPCELRLTQIMSRAATRRVLEDAHHHFAGAVHRRAAALMGDSDIDATLSSLPTIEQTHTYGHIFVNGIPMLLSRRPGGGDLFYPLAFEEESCGYAAEGELPVDPVDLPGTGDERPACYADGTPRPVVLPPSDAKRLLTGRRQGTSVFWYHPTESLFTHTRQIPHVDALARADPLWRRGHVRQSQARSSLSIHHVPVTVHRLVSAVEPAAVPLQPQLQALVPQRVLHRPPKRERSSAPSDAHTNSVCAQRALLVYTQHTHDLEAIGSLGTTTGADEDRQIATSRCIVHADAAYRVTLLCEVPPTRCVSEAPQLGVTLSGDNHVPADTEAVAVTLTEEALRRHVASLPGARAEKAAHVHSSYLSPTSGPRDSAALSQLAPTEDSMKEKQRKRRRASLSGSSHSPSGNRGPNSALASPSSSLSSSSTSSSP